MLSCSKRLCQWHRFYIIHILIVIIPLIQFTNSVEASTIKNHGKYDFSAVESTNEIQPRALRRNEVYLQNKSNTWNRHIAKYPNGKSKKDGEREKGHSANIIMVRVTINSTGVALYVNDDMVFSSINKTMTFEAKSLVFHAGIHLVILHHVTGQVMRAESFMTWQLGSDSHLVNALNKIQDGRLLVFIGMPDFVSHLTSETIDILMKYGSWFVHSLANNEMWCFAVYKGGQVILESANIDSNYNSTIMMDVSPINLQFEVAPMEERLCKWYKTPNMIQQAAFCETYEGYGNLCSCHNTYWKPKPVNSMDYLMQEEIPVAIITSRRIPQVLDQIIQIWQSPGGLETPIWVFVDGHNPEARALGTLLNITVVEHDTPEPPGSTSRISQHVKFSLQEIFRRLPHVEKAIILEDDLDLAPDFIPYFHQTAPLLDADDQLLCVNAYNYNAFNHTAFDSDRLYRTHGAPAYGWMVARRKAQEMVKKWAPVNSTDWDYWLWHSMSKNKNDIIIPEIPRTKHRGGGRGVHVSGLEQTLYFNQRAFNTEVNVTIDIKSLQKNLYLTSHINAIRTAKVIRFDDHPCKNVPIPRDKVNDTFVIYVYQPSESHPSKAFYVVSRCLGLNDRDLHETLSLMVTVPFFKNRVYVIGCPNSPFCFAQHAEDIYHATSADVHFANSHPFRPATVTSIYARRISSTSFRDFVLLTNLHREIRVTVWK